ncbi:MAG: glycosyltransferase [Chitinophagaceae bacterium]|nr:glycosyltransferase [Chitinophagaceae bacterium]
MKVIHIVENLDKGAVENWLVNIFIESRKIRPEWDWTFYCILGKEGRLDERVRNAGGKIIYSPVTISHKAKFLKHLRNVLRAGRYDIIHSHHDYLSGFYLLASAGIKFRRRFLHVHNTDKALPVGNKTVHNLLLRPFRTIGSYLSDTIIGISKNTLAEFTGSEKIGKRHAILYYGIDMSRFNVPALRSEVRKNLNLPENSRILLYAGRMNDLKNPEFVVDVLMHLLKLRPDVYAVFIGSGDKEKNVIQKAQTLNITSHIRQPGWYDNVPVLMKSSDVFVFPRKEYPKEGLGLVVVEAQAAGLPMFITEGIVPDAIVIPELAHVNSLHDPKQWAEQINEVLNKSLPISPEESLELMKNSAFELGAAARNLVDLYEH